MRIIRYFGDNPKAGPLQLIFPSIYNFFSKLLVLHSLPNRDDKTVASALGVNPFFAKDYIRAASFFNRGDCEKLLLLLYEYNLRSLGVNDAGTEDDELLQELVLRMIAA
jgi:DNA polymerase-3 subunit delta